MSGNKDRKGAKKENNFNLNFILKTEKSLLGGKYRINQNKNVSIREIKQLKTSENVLIGGNKISRNVKIKQRENFCLRKFIALR